MVKNKSFQDWLKEEPPIGEVASLTLEGGLYLPIEVVETLLDTFNSWSTQNFKWQLYKNGYSDNCVAASIEVVVEYRNGVSVNEDVIKRTFTGACNFSIKALYPNDHFLATAKSECVKNAMSDIGRRFGRSLNQKSAVPIKENITASTDGVSLHDGIEQYKFKANAT